MKSIASIFRHAAMLLNKGVNNTCCAAISNSSQDLNGFDSEAKAIKDQALRLFEDLYRPERGLMFWWGYPFDMRKWGCPPGRGVAFDEMRNERILALLFAAEIAEEENA